jgi:hypothetical protein
VLYPYDNSFWLFEQPIPEFNSGSAASTSNLGVDPIWDMSAFSNPSDMSFFNNFSSLSNQNLFAPALAPLDFHLWDPTSSSFAAPSTPVSLDGSIASLTSTTAATLSAIPSDINTATVTCQWNGCGAVVDATSISKHLKTAHPGEVARARECRWSGCTQAPADLRKHVVLHYNVVCPCDTCGETFTREDALRRHQRRGTCKRCSWCRVLFNSIEERTAHSNTCLKRGVAAKAGRSRRVGKVGVPAREAAHPYMK